MRVTPRAGRDAIGSEWRGANGKSWLSVRLAAAPSDGAANEALIRLLARKMGLRMRDVALANGASSRLKQLHLTGDGAALAARLATLCKESE